VRCSWLLALAFGSIGPGGSAAAQTVADAQTALARNDPRTAVAILGGLVDHSPRDADLRLRLAGAQAATGDYRAALATIDLARTLAPADLDIRAARTRILLWSGDRSAARRALAEIVAADPGFPEIAAIERQLVAPREGASAQHGLSAAFGVARIQNASGSQTWSTATVSGYTAIGAATTVDVEIMREKRQQIDTHLAATIVHKVGPAYLHLGVTATPKADFRERWSINFGGEVPFGRAVTALLDLRHARYSNVSVSVVEPGIRYRLAGRVALTARWINLFGSGDRYRTGASLRGDYDLGGNRAIYAGAASYPDTEAGVTRQVHSYFAGGVAPLSARLALRAGAAHERRTLSYTSRSATLGLSWRLGG